MKLFSFSCASQKVRGASLHEARLENVLTQEELTEKEGSTKSYISKIETDIKEVTLSYGSHHA